MESFPWANYKAPAMAYFKHHWWIEEAPFDEVEVENRWQPRDLRWWGRDKFLYPNMLDQVHPFGEEDLGTAGLLCQAGTRNVFQRFIGQCLGVFRDYPMY